MRNTRVGHRGPGRTRVPGRILVAAVVGAAAGLASALGLRMGLGTTAAASSPGSHPVVAVGAPATPAADPRPVVAFGDSLTYGWGVPPDQSYTTVLQRLMGERVITVGLPGKPSAVGLGDVPAVLALDPKVVLLEFGSVDACLGVPMQTAASNVDRILTVLDAHGIGAVIVGTRVGDDRMPHPSICPQMVHYESAWDAALQALAHRHHSALALDVLRGLGAQPDGYHPDVPGQAVMAERVAVALRGLEATAWLPA